MTLLMTVSLAQCPCPASNILPLIVAGFAAWGLWRASEWIGNWFANQRGAGKESGARGVRTGIVFAALACCILLAFGAVNALRPSPAVELTPTEHPRLVFLGAERCGPCQAMEPVREALRTKYVNGLTIEYHDVSKDAEAGHRFGIRSIPTTVFVAPSGKELLRRQGFLSEEDIVNKWNEIGFDLKKGIGYDADE